MFGLFSPENNVYNNYTADDPRSRRRVSLHEGSIWGPASSTERSVPLDFNIGSENMTSGQGEHFQNTLHFQNQAVAPDLRATGGLNLNPNPHQNPIQNMNQNSNPNPSFNHPTQQQPMFFSNSNEPQFIYATGVQSINKSPPWSPQGQFQTSILAGPDQMRMPADMGLPRKYSDHSVSYFPSLLEQSRNFTQQAMAPNLWSDSSWHNTLPLERMEGNASNLPSGRPFTTGSNAHPHGRSASIVAVDSANTPTTSLADSFMHGVNLNAPPTQAMQSGQLRRHSYGEGFGTRLQGQVGGNQKSSALASHLVLETEDTQTNRAVLQYFTSDPHERVKVTSEYLEQRFFDEEKYLGDLYQLPKFPVDNLLRAYLLVLVGFKAGRIDAFYLPDSVPELKNVKIGDLVIVEADRGRDLGMVVKMNISIDEARLLKLLQFLEQQAALIENMSVNDLSVKSLQSSGGSHHGHHGSSAPPTLHFPKSILALAQPNEIMQILNKKQDEEKACRLCLAKIASTTSMLNSGDTQSTLTSTDLMQMKLIDAEYQFDRRKLIFYYSTSKRIDFRDLVRELFRIYKTRIWMCAVNGIPYVPQHQKPKGGKPGNQARSHSHLSASSNGGGKNSGNSNGSNGKPSATNGDHQYLSGEQASPGSFARRRFSENSGSLIYSNRLQNAEYGVPRNYHGGKVEEEIPSNFGSRESLVLKSLVDTLNH